MTLKSLAEAAPPRVLAVSSTGGHWEQLMLLAPAFEAADRVFACTDARQGAAYGLTEVIGLKDYSASAPFDVLKGAIETFRLVRRIRPDVVISTGAAPGLLCLLWGRLLGAHTIWVDSIANSSQLSLSGRLAARFSHVTLTQWEHLADGSGITYRGSVI